MDSIDKINEKIKEKLVAYDLTLFEELDDKTLKRLYEIETCISEMESEAKELDKKLKATKPNVTKIISYDKVSITKKTAYNNPIIIKYIELSKDNFPDYFNEEKIKNMEKSYEELNDMYNKVIDNIIDDYNKENEKTLLIETIETLKKENDTLKKIIEEKDRDIELINVKKNNKIISINKYGK